MCFNNTGWKSLVVHREAVVLGRDVAAARSHVDARLVARPVAELHLVRLGPRREGEELVAEADPEDRLVVLLLKQRSDPVGRLARCVARGPAPARVDHSKRERVLASREDVEQEM